MNLKKVLIALLIAQTSFVNAQTSILEINSEIILPKDSIESELLINSLNQFLVAIRTKDENNSWIYSPQKIETSILIDELKDVERSKKFNDAFFYKPYLTNIIPLKSGQYFIQISYLGIKDNTSYLRVNCEFIAHKADATFKFSSPLTRNTEDWKTKQIENIIFHFKDSMNIMEAEEFQQLTYFFDERLNIEQKENHFYFINDDITVQKLIGLPYKSDYNGEGGSNVWSITSEKKELFLCNESVIIDNDPHDYWHTRLSKVRSRDDVNYLVDEAIATLYGGTWNLSWKDVFNVFLEQIAPTKNTDWLKHRREETLFGIERHKRPTDFMINILLVKKIEQEKGFVGVWELLNSKEDEMYFKTLEKLTGISKSNYNKQVWELINNVLDENSSI